MSSDTAAAGAFDLGSCYLRLRPDCSIEPIPVDETFWPRLMSGQLGSFHHEYLVSSFNYEQDWNGWEMHPNGDEIVCLLSGAVLFILEGPQGRREIELTGSGSYVLVPRGTWHTARISQPSRMLFITAGEGTQNRPVT